MASRATTEEEVDGRDRVYVSLLVRQQFLRVLLLDPCSGREEHRGGVVARRNAKVQFQVAEMNI